MAEERMGINEQLAALAESHKKRNEEMDRSNERMERFHEKFQADMERLKERHEALAQSVEINQHQFARHQEFFAQHEQLFGEIALRFKDTRETIDRLARIAGVHQDRLDEHGHRLDNLEPH
jgi:cell division septum initiation protein DivIVA